MARKRIGQGGPVGPLLSFSAGLVFLALMDLCLRAVLPPTRLENVLRILKEDPVLLWVQKPGLREDFFGTRVETDAYGLREGTKSSGSETLRVLCLGASPTFGWGVEGKRAYPAGLERLLREKFGDKAGVINGGVIGYSSWQGLGFLERHGEKLRPDVITVAYVINDVDSYRFFRNDGRADREFEAENGAGRAARGFLRESGIGKALLRLFPGAPPPPGENRVSEKDYRANLSDLAQWARSRGADVVFIKMPVNLPAGEAAQNPERAKLLAGMARRAYDMGDREKARSFAREALAADGNSGRARHLLGLCETDPEKAAAHFRLAKEAESRRGARDARRYNEAMAEVAAEAGVPLVDAAALFAREKDYLFVDPAKDTIHPNERGHELIARALFAAVEPLALKRQK